MNKKTPNRLLRVRRIFAAATVAFLPAWFGIQKASAAINDEMTTTTLSALNDNAPTTTQFIGPLLPTIPPTIPTTTIRVPVTFPPSPTTLPFPKPDPNAPEDCSYVTVEMTGCTTTTMAPTTTAAPTTTTSTTTTTIPATTTSTSTTTSTTSTTMAPTTTVAPTTTTSTTTTVAPTTTVVPAIVVPSTLGPTYVPAPVTSNPNPETTLATTGNSTLVPLAVAALASIATGFALVQLSDKRRFGKDTLAPVTSTVGNANVSRRTFIPSRQTSTQQSQGPNATLSRSAAPSLFVADLLELPKVNMPLLRNRVIKIREVTPVEVPRVSEPKVVPVLELKAAPKSVAGLRDRARAERAARAEAESIVAPIETIPLDGASARFDFNAIAL